jgi:DNA-binding response OmpR family regulator
MPRLLIADDEERIRDIVKKFFTQNGFDVTAVPDGAAALTALDAAVPFDIVILDKRMPFKSGIDVLREMRGRGHQTPVILFSGELNIDDSHFEELEALGYPSEDILGKPVNFSYLLQLVRRKLESTGR